MYSRATIVYRSVAFDALLIELVRCITGFGYNYPMCPGGEIGRRNRFRFYRRKVCRFESDLGHH